MVAGGIAAATVAWATLPALSTGASATAGASLTAGVTVAGIEAQQAAVVRSDHRQVISTAQDEVDRLQSNLGRDQATLSADQAVADHAGAVKAAAEAHLRRDQVALTAAISASQLADARVTQDRTRMQAIAIGMYTGQLTNPQPAGLHALEEDQQAIIDAAQVAVVAGVVDRYILSDTATADADAKQQAQLAAAASADKETAASAAATAAEHGARLSSDQSTVASDQAALGDAQYRLGAAQLALQASLDAVGLGTDSGAMTVLGGAALDASQLSGWYYWMGYADLTSTPVQQFAAWYLQAGAAEGVRGDVAFAQAVLETGGFSSPDSIAYNNYAGIGHCDSCSSGWTFPSPYDGVLGQVQLLRIWAGGGSPAHPVIPSLTVSHQHEAGCCDSFESLTGVWATDPTYGSQILGLYQGMLTYALSGSGGI